MVFVNPKSPNLQTSKSPNGFTLVELLVVITIIGILIALLLPAVQAAREAARQTQCKNHLHQIGIGCLNHEQVHGFLPTAGWSHRWVGYPTRGFDKRQPGGWLYNILPYIEQEQLHELGTGADNYTVARMGTPISIFHCPSCRPAKAYPVVGWSNQFWYNVRPTVVGRSDYAGCAGYCEGTLYDGPTTLSAGDKLNESQWLNYNRCPGGVFCRRSMTKLCDITDGTSNTYMAGERYMSPDYYDTGTSPDDDQGWDQGIDNDSIRCVTTSSFVENMSNPAASNDSCAPFQHQSGVLIGVFGSAHANGFHMAFCDGSVHVNSYSIQSRIYAYLGLMADGYVIDGNAF